MIGVLWVPPPLSNGPTCIHSQSNDLLESPQCHYTMFYLVRFASGSAVLSKYLIFSTCSASEICVQKGRVFCRLQL